MSETQAEKKLNGGAPVFDAERPMRIRLQGGKEVVVRFPTDDEWVDWRRRRKVVTKQLGRGKTETLPASQEQDAELVAKLVNGDGPEIDEYEAAIIVEELTRADLDEIEPEGDGYRVTLTVPGGTTTSHAVGMPSAKEIIKFRRAYARSIDQGNRSEITINLQAAADLYAKLCSSSVGYAGKVPIIHQAAALRAAIDSLESGLGVAEPENF